MKQQDQNPLDKLFRDAAERHRMQPHKQVWDHIQEDQLRKKNRSRPLLWVFTALAVISAAGLTGYFVLYQDNITDTIAFEKTSAASNSENREMERAEKLTEAKIEPFSATEQNSSIKIKERSAELQNANPEKVHKDVVSGQPEKFTEPARSPLTVVKLQVRLLPVETDKSIADYKANAISTVMINQVPSTDPSIGELTSDKDSETGTKWFVSVAGGPQFMDHSLTGEEFYKEYTQKRNAAESAGTGYSIKLEAGRYIGKHIFLSSAVQYNQLQMRSQFSYNNYYDQTSTRVDTSVRLDMQQKRIIVWYDTITTTKTLAKENNISSTIKYNSISIPLNIGVETGAKKWQIGARAGVGLVLLTDIQGTVASPDSYTPQGVDLSDLPIRKVNIAVQATGIIGYNPCQSWTVFAGPSYSHNLLSTFRQSFPVKQLNYSYGLLGGVKKSF